MTKGARLLVAATALVLAVVLWRTEPVQRRWQMARYTLAQMRHNVTFFVHWNGRGSNDRKPDEPGAGGRQPD